jgi:DNA topoisomerase-2
MAQNFVGSNNIHLLNPNGQFGTRLQGGDDAASERYIFTQLNPLARLIFPEPDDAVLNNLNDDGSIVEPEFYVPILPFCLVNGVSGIGTGFSTDIPSFNPKTIVSYLRAKLASTPYPSDTFVPYYEGFKGSVTKVQDNKYLIRGTYTKIGEDKIKITELPIGTWTMPYLTYLDELVDGGVDKTGKKLPPVLKDVVNLSTEVAVDITVQFPKGKLATMSQSDIDTLLKLTTTVSTTNMHLFDADCRLHKYLTIEEIIDDFFVTRMKTYQKRKEALLLAMETLLVRLSNRAKYILETLSGEVDLRKKSNQQVVDLLKGRGYVELEGDYKYLIKLPMDSVTEENVAKILQEKEELSKELEVLRGTSLEEMWLKELDVFEKEYTKLMKK